ncbi:Flp pilus assembly complex ATPase component TadA [Candidatus Sumerlaeota bacterium]|nr:Flp pilus assembly complex ATPase component TadA [Candidatus Sumerlaeota bacterium]
MAFPVLRAKSFDNSFDAQYDCTADIITIGRDENCDVVIARGTVSKQHAHLIRRPGGYSIRDAGSKTGIYVNAEKIVDTRELFDGDKIIIGDVLLEYEAPPMEDYGSSPIGVETMQIPGGSSPLEPGATMEYSPEVLRRMQSSGAAGAMPPSNATVQYSSEELEAMRQRGGPGAVPGNATVQYSPEQLEAMKHQQGAVPRPPGSGDGAPPPPPRPSSRREAESGKTVELNRETLKAGAVQGVRNPFVTGKKKRSEASDSYTKLRAAIHEQLVEKIRLKTVSAEKMADEELWNRARTITNQIIYDLQKSGSLQHDVSPKQLLKDVLDEALGLGPIQDFLDDHEIEEIMVNGPAKIFVARRGKTVRTDKQFIDEERLLTIINRIVAPLGRPINQARPMVDARLADGSRVNAIIPPVSLIGPVLTIRKFPAKPLTPKDLMAKGSFSPGMAKFLELAVKMRQNIFIAGGTASGKTTLLNVISSYIPNDERILTIEDSAELQLQQEHVISLETRPSNTEGATSVAIRDLVKNALRMRPDRIVVGEIRSGEAIDMLQAMNTGHDGSLSTGHANSGRDMLTRLETMCLMAGLDLPLLAIREQIARAVNMVVFVERFPDGRRRIGEIIEVLGLDGNEYVTQSIYKFEYKLDAKGGMTGDFIPVGTIPNFLRIHKERGGDVPFEIFQPSTDSGT